MNQLTQHAQRSARAPRRIRFLIAAGAVAQGLHAADVAPPAEPMSVWFVKPGNSFHESCVLGNGRLGAMDFGGIEKQRVVLNESSVWTGGAYDGNHYEAYKCLPEVRAEVVRRRHRGRRRPVGRQFPAMPNGVAGWGDANQFGCYQILGDLTLSSRTAPRSVRRLPARPQPDDRRRPHRVHARRRALHPRTGGLEAGRSPRPAPQGDKPGALTFTAALSRQQHADTRAEGAVHVLEGQLPFNKPGGGGEGVRYLALLGAQARAARCRRPTKGLRGRGRGRGGADRVGRHRSVRQGLRRRWPAGGSRRRWQSRSTQLLRAAAADHRRLHGPLPADAAGGAERGAADAGARARATSRRPIRRWRRCTSSSAGI